MSFWRRRTAPHERPMKARFGSIPRWLRLLTLATFLVASLAAPRGVRADDVADEADLQFQLGAERYQAADYRGALQHFLASNRLVANKNVMFNIARTYEQLGQFPEAYRYYTLTLQDANEAMRARVKQSMDRIAPNVAVLQVTSKPPGASIYIDRKDLGARGVTPASLGFEKGAHKVILELPGYEPAEIGPVDLSRGQTTPVTATLREIIGTVTIKGGFEGAQVRVDDDKLPPTCSLPCNLTLRPGRHVIFLSAPGHETQAALVEVAPNQTIAVKPDLRALRVPLTVNTDVREALVTVDGTPVGFTPLVASIPVGKHLVRVTLEGFRPVEQTVDVAPTEQVRLDLQLFRVESVVAASRATESVEDAPSSVTVITREELRAMGYPTVAEALRGVRGIYLSDDRSYASIGFRGFSRAGDYGNRVLILVDGHPTNISFTGASFVGYDARVDLEDVDRIEIVRGPGSVLYGTGAFFGVINLVTRSHWNRICQEQDCKDKTTHIEAGMGTSEYGVGRGRASALVRRDEESGVWVSAAAARAQGRDFFTPEYATTTPPDVTGNSRNVDGFDAATASGRAWYKAFSVQWHGTTRTKLEPVGKFSTIYADPRSSIQDNLGFVEARFEPRLSPQIQLATRAHANAYSFIGLRAFPDPISGLAKVTYQGQWFGFEQRIMYMPVDGVRIMLGGEIIKQAKVQQRVSNERAGILLDRNDPYFVAAGYAVVDAAFNRYLKVSAGARYDYYEVANVGGALNPRIAVITHPYETGTAKVIVGKAFRAPSAYELFFSAGVIQPSVNLQPEDIYTGEVEFTHRFSTTVSASVAGYANRVTRLLLLRPVGGATSPFVRYENSPDPIRTLGGEFELKREWRGGWMAGVTYAFQNTTLESGTSREVANSPQHIASIKGAVPVIPKYLQGMTRVSLEGPRFDRYERDTDPGQLKHPGGVITDLVLSGETDSPHVRYNLGVYNLFDWQYSVPVSAEFRQRTISQAGRTFLANVVVSF